MHDTVRIPTQKQRTAGTILLIEDEETLGRGLVRLIETEGYKVVHVTTAAEAIDRVMKGSFDAVISDLNLGGVSGVDVLNIVRAYDQDVPMILLTGSPSMETAIEAVSLGVMEYLVKPATREQMVRVLGRATTARRKTNLHREAQSMTPQANRSTMPASGMVSDGMRAALDRALASLAVTLDPVVQPRSRDVIGFAARIRSNEPTLETEAALVVAAERLGVLQDLRRRGRDLAVKAFADAAPGSLLFVDVHQSDLMDGDLYSSDPPLARIADRVVLQVRGRAASMGIEDLAARASVLRFLGFRIAISDLDEGQACLSQIAELAPEFVKIDQRLVRGIESSPARRRIVAALVSMCNALDSKAVAEGVSTAEERDALVVIGCDLVQGSLVARHSPDSIRRQMDRVAS